VGDVVHQCRTLLIAEVDDFDEAGLLRHEHQPRKSRVVVEQHLAKRELAERKGFGRKPLVNGEIHSGDTAFKPMMPTTISAMQPSRSGFADSPSHAMPSATVPIVPMPVQIA